MSIRDKTITKKAMEREVKDVFSYILSRITAEPGKVLFTHEFFWDYQVWRNNLEMTPTELSQDSFGRIFFVHFPRTKKVVYRDKEIGRGLTDYGFNT